MLVAKNISKAISQEFSVREVSFSAEHGTITVIVGQNGSGKSSLLKLLSLVQVPDEGSININGKNLSFPCDLEYSQREAFWPDVSLVFQQLFLWPHLSVEKNLSLGLTDRFGESSHDSLGEVAQQLAITNLLQRYPNELSGGQKQRVAIARALVLKPKWLLLDEPTSALDVLQINQLSSILTDLKKSGIGIIVVSHYLGFAAHIADKVAYLHEGRLIEDGDVSILTNPKTREFREFLTLLEPID